MKTPRAANTCVFAALFLFLAAALPTAALPAPAVPQQGGDADGMEEFEEVDPYTENDPERMALLGYKSYGPFQWKGGDSNVLVQQDMGGIPMLWVETEHFRIGSSLGTYKIPGDREEKKRIKDELASLKKKLGKFKAPRNELDPWLRLHLYAQRVEDTYAAFLEDFDLEPKDYEQIGPYLGQPGKFLVLLCQRQSEYSRYMRTYVGVENDTSYRWGWGDCMGFGVNLEHIEKAWWGTGAESIPYDSVLHAQMAAGLASMFVEGYQRSLFGAPLWLNRALAHRNARRVDERYVSGAGHSSGQQIGEDDHLWEVRIQKLVKNDFYAPTTELFGWSEYGDMDVRDHMAAWSRLDYLLRGAEGDRRGFLHALCKPRPTGTPEEVKAKMIARQEEALAINFKLTPEELDAAWAKWVKKNYAKR